MASLTLADIVRRTVPVTKASKETAKYQGRPKGKDRCGKCTMFRKPDRCNAVIGEISPTGWCKYFEAKKQDDRGKLWYG